jgi:DNA-binding NarL/FixJ family response regulator
MPTTVLIVDDHPSFRATVRLLLESEGYAVVGEAETGTAGLRKARELAPTCPTPTGSPSPRS